LRAVAFIRSARRGRRRPARAPGGAVFASLRLRCGTRIEVVPDNSLRSLRSLRSNRIRQVRSRSALRAPTSMLRSSPPHRSPPPGTACREAPLWALATRTLASARARPGRGRRACGAPSIAGLMAARASARRDLTHRVCPSAVREANVASYAMGHEPEKRRAGEARHSRTPPTARPRLCRAISRTQMDHWITAGGCCVPPGTGSTGTESPPSPTARSRRCGCWKSRSRSRRAAHASGGAAHAR
jgi:hypothetical protein